LVTGGRRPRNTESQVNGRQDRIRTLITDFPRFLKRFTNDPPFKKAGQLSTHVATIQLRRKLGSAKRAITDDRFLHSLHETLVAWGIGVRASRLLPVDQFAQKLREKSADITALENLRIDDPVLDVKHVSSMLWSLVETLEIVGNNAKIVSCTKALHHILPDLVVPVDRAYTQRFFGWNTPAFQYNQAAVFHESFTAFVDIARSVKLEQYIGDGWNSSITKVIDNAIVGMLCEAQ
jgi:hypothetical protein